MTRWNAEHELEAEHRPVARSPHARGGRPSRTSRRAMPAIARSLAVDLRAGRVARRGWPWRAARPRRRDGHRRRPLARGQRLELGARTAALRSSEVGRPLRRGGRGSAAGRAGRLRLRRPTGLRLERVAQLAGRGLGVRGLGDRAHDRRSAAHRRRAPRRRCPRRCRRWRTTARGACRRRGGRSSSPAAGPPGLRRRGVDGPDGDVVDAGARVDLRRPCGSSARRSTLRPDDRPGPLRPDMSSWPTCTPSAPRAAARSGRSLSMNSAPARRSRPRKASAAASSWSSSPSCREAGRRRPRRRGPRAGSPRDRRARSHTR